MSHAAMIAPALAAKLVHEDSGRAVKAIMRMAAWVERTTA